MATNVRTLKDNCTNKRRKELRKSTNKCELNLKIFFISWKHQVCLYFLTPLCVYNWFLNFIKRSLFQDAKSYGWQVPCNISHSWEELKNAVQGHIKSVNWVTRVELRDKYVFMLNLSNDKYSILLIFSGK